MLKMCARCKEQKPTGDFYVSRFAKSGFTSYCKPCLRAYSSAYLVANRETVMRQKAEYLKANPRDPIKNRQRVRLYKSTHPDVVRAQKSTRRGRLRGAEGKFTAADIQRLLLLQRHQCLGCAARLQDGFHIDHVVPLASGGSNSALNLQLLCPPCNISKGARPNAEFMQRRGLLL